MQNLKEKIQIEIKNAMKSGENEKVGALRMFQAEIKNAEIVKRTKLAKEGIENLEEKSVLTDEEIVSVAGKEIKKRKDAIELYQKGNRSELAEKEQREVDVLSVYMPEQMSEDEIRNIVKKAIEQSGVSSVKEMGKVMGILTPQTKGKADGTLVSKIVKEFLN